MCDHPHTDPEARTQPGYAFLLFDTGLHRIFGPWLGSVKLASACAAALEV